MVFGQKVIISESDIEEFCESFEGMKEISVSDIDEFVSESADVIFPISTAIADMLKEKGVKIHE